MKKRLALLLVLLLALALAGCADPVIGDPAPGDEQAAATPPADAVILLEGDSASYPGGGVAISGSTVTVTAPGTYAVRGTLNDGQLIVNTGEIPGNVTLVFDGADVTCLGDSAVYVAQAKNVNIVLAAGSVNRVCSGVEADMAAWNDQATGAAIFAEDDLDIKGEGSLAVYGYRNSGIVCKDDLDLQGGTVTVLAANNGVRGSESVCITGGSLTVEAGHDGVKATSAKKEGKGWLHVEGGTVSVVCQGDGLSAESELTVSGGSVSVRTKGDPDELSCKGLKAKTALTVSGGTLDVEAQDHALHSAGPLSVTGGSVRAVSAAAKGLAAHETITVADCELTVRAAKDGLESVTELVFESGVVNVTAAEDGLKAGEKGTGFDEPTGAVTVRGGEIRVSAGEDPIDAGRGLTVEGGSLFAIGSSFSKQLNVTSSLPCLRFSSGGASGVAAKILLGKTELFSLNAFYDFNTVWLFDEGLTSGTEYILSAGGSRALAKAVS
ncbi:MAG: carbohydrate-binding domain-containing protein [Oscillospiraceae bacterium]|nr:carbohydrate-binding domain-containing protein [Oscillospiraceae bacterium]